MLDRLIQQALHQVLSPLYEPTFSDHSYGFRAERSAHQALQKAQGYIRENRRHVVDIDLSKFFDEVHHNRLLSKLRLRVEDKRVIHLIDRYLRAGMMRNGVEEKRIKGTPQGSPLSPLLSNIVLDELDKELENRRLCFVRYADDFQIYVRTQRSAERVMGSVSRFIDKKLKLKVNEHKSAVGRPWTRLQELMRRGLSEERAVQSAFNKRRPWWNAGASHMNQAYPKQYFDKLGLVNMEHRLNRRSR